MTFYEIAILYKGVRSKTDSFQKIYTNKGDNMKSLKQYTLVGIIFVISLAAYGILSMNGQAITLLSAFSSL